MQKDTLVFDLIQKELERQRHGIELIASENFTSLQVMQAGCQSFGSMQFRFDVDIRQVCKTYYSFPVAGGDDARCGSGDRCGVVASCCQAADAGGQSEQTQQTGLF